MGKADDNFDLILNGIADVAFFSADVLGYSLLIRDNEEATVRTLNTNKEMIFTHIEQSQGRLVDSTGDNLLAEFAIDGYLESHVSKRVGFYIS